jgi:hypothetical protein
MDWHSSLDASLPHHTKKKIFHYMYFEIPANSKDKDMNRT